MRLNDLNLQNHYLQLEAESYHKVSPTPLRGATLLDYNIDVLELLGLDPAKLDEDMLRNILNGKHLLQGSEPYAMCYAGHQFGFYAQRLGDGRAINLGAVKGWNLQLKGSGPTRYSRNGDGRAVLRSSIREYLMSEAMYHLGVPTTRALAIIGSQEEIQREKVEKGSIVLRLSPSWIRFGSFEYFFYKRKYDELRALANYAIKESYPQLAQEKEAYLLFFKAVVASTATMVSHWQAIGFNHGVMNTDNMSIAGLSIDYGPFAFLDHYDTNYICNHSDHEGRYSFGAQPYIAQWNLSKLLKALTPLCEEKKLEKELELFRPLYTSSYSALMRSKLGLYDRRADDASLIRSLLKLLNTYAVDYTPFFRTLSRYNGDQRIFSSLYSSSIEFSQWFEAYDKRLCEEESCQSERQNKMLAVNPKYVLKNYMLQEAIDLAENADLSGVQTLKILAQSPYDEHPVFERYAQATPSQYKNMQLSCSS